MVPRKVRDSSLGAERKPHPVGRAFARRMLRGPGIIAPCPGMDSSWVIRQCHASWTQTALRDCAAACVLIASEYLFPAGKSVWLGLLAAALLLSALWRKMRKPRRRLAAVVLVCAVVFAVCLLIHGGQDFRSLGVPLLGFGCCVRASTSPTTRSGSRSRSGTRCGRMSSVRHVGTTQGDSAALGRADEAKLREELGIARRSANCSWSTGSRATACGQMGSCSCSTAESCRQGNSTRSAFSRTRSHPSSTSR